MPELWQPVEGYEGLYEVSDLGRVRSVERRVPHRNGLMTVKERILRATLCGPKNYEYRAVALSKDGKPVTHKVHRLVAKAFIGIPEGYEVNHKDLDKFNNCLSNLEVVTHQQNQLHAGAHGRLGNGWQKRKRDEGGKFL